jgi:hypothetical protein
LSGRYAFSIQATVSQYTNNASLRAGHFLLRLGRLKKLLVSDTTINKFIFKGQFYVIGISLLSTKIYFANMAN